MCGYFVWLGIDWQNQSGQNGQILFGMRVTEFIAPNQCMYNNNSSQ